jgi:PII-like signaling protein
MSNVVLRIYIPRNAKVTVRFWKYFRRRTALSRYLLERAREAAIGQAELFQVIAGYLDGGSENRAKSRSNIPDCLDIVGSREDLRAFCELYEAQLAASSIIWLTPEQVETSPRWLPSVIERSKSEM